MGVDEFIIELSRWIGAGMLSCIVAKVVASLGWSPVLWFRGMIR